jgi:hypothetical protein
MYTMDWNVLLLPIRGYFQFCLAGNCIACVALVSCSVAELLSFFSLWHVPTISFNSFLLPWTCFNLIYLLQLLYQDISGQEICFAVPCTWCSFCPFHAVSWRWTEHACYMAPVAARLCWKVSDWCVKFQGIFWLISKALLLMQQKQPLCL